VTTGATLSRTATSQNASPTPLLLYVSVPFCNSKCHFCDWVVRVPVHDLRLQAGDSPRQRYIEAVLSQIAATAPVLRAKGYQPQILYFGGGTGSILSEVEVTSIMHALTSSFDTSAVIESTMESSPETLTLAKLRLFHELGFNRVSIGVQAFDDGRLRQIGRAHSAREAVQAVVAASTAGFRNINIDLIVGFPAQSLDEIRRTLIAAVGLPVNHFSIYPYRPSLGTVLRKRLDKGWEPPLELEAQYQAYLVAREVLESHGYSEYAMSYFGFPHCASDEAYYNLKMDWMGFGSGANSVIAHRYLAHNRGLMHRYSEQPMEYDVLLPASSPEVVLGFLSQALTTPQGMEARRFYERTGVALVDAISEPAVAAYLDRLAHVARVIRDADGIRLHPDDMARAQITLNWVGAPAA
jgi:putative oxygen-independent coproporphyrinogen III oxidase